MLVQFELPLIKTIYANMMDKGRLSLLVEDPNNRQKQMKVLIHDVETEQLKKFVEIYETVMRERKAVV